MTTPLLERTWPACLSALQLDRWMLGELRQTESELVSIHLSGCGRCARMVDAMRAHRDATQLPRLRLLTVAPTIPTDEQRRPPRRWKVRAAAASKGPGFAIAMYVQHEGEVRRVGPGETIAAGDAVRFAVTAPVKAYVAILSLDAAGGASIYYPAGRTAQQVPAGDDLPLPLGTRLDETVGQERVVGLFCSSPVELEPLRVRLENGIAAFPHECQVTQWTFVKR
jgi:hypothetical protein